MYICGKSPQIIPIFPNPVLDYETILLGPDPTMVTTSSVTTNCGALGPTEELKSPGDT